MTRAENSEFDLAVAYRIYPRVSKPAVGLPFSEDKYLLSEVCLRSFRESLGDLRAKIWVLLDGCPPEYTALFRKYFAQEELHLVPLGGVGNRATFSKQIEILLAQQETDFVYFAEDDYFYLPNQFHLMLDFLAANEDVHFVSPYDHLDCYRLELHRGPKWLRVQASVHWRTAASTCLTFLTKRQTLAKYESVFRSYTHGNDDCALWLSLTKHRVFNAPALGRYFFRGLFYWKILVKAWVYGWRQILFGKKLRLWVPIPAIATHLDTKALSPSVDWIALMEQGAEVESES
jgi:hypothetical protein